MAGPRAVLGKHSGGENLALASSGDEVVHHREDGLAANLLQYDCESSAAGRLFRFEKYNV